MSEQDARTPETAQPDEHELTVDTGMTSETVEVGETNTALTLGEERRLGNVMEDDAVADEMGRRTRRTFLIGAAAAVAAYGGWRWLKSAEMVEGLPSPLRASHEFNSKLSEAYFNHSRRAPEFPRSRAREPRVNGGEGMSEGFSPESWRLQIVGVAGARTFGQYRDSVAHDTATDNMNARDDSSRQHESANTEGAAKEASDGEPGKNESGKTPATEMDNEGLLLTLDDIRALPKVEMTTEIKCIEGWSEVAHWAGARFADFAAKFNPPTRDGGGGKPDVAKRPQDLVRYVSLTTPDGGYYVGLDMASALHPQTLLCYEMNGQPLTLEHGAPLRLYIPVKYGIKSIKRIGRIEFTDTRPADFWAERGYDWHSGH